MKSVKINSSKDLFLTYGNRTSLFRAVGTVKLVRTGFYNVFFLPSFISPLIRFRCLIAIGEQGGGKEKRDIKNTFEGIDKQNGCCQIVHQFFFLQKN